jgi:hypothetical protein
MKPLAIVLGFCAVVVSGSAGVADQSCKAKAIQQKLAGEALLNFVKQCELDALIACADQTAGKPDGERMDACAAKALGVGPKWCAPHECRNNSDCTGGAGCSVCWAGICGK